MEEHKNRNSFVDRRRKSLTFNDIFSESNEEVNKQRPKFSVQIYKELLTAENQEWKDILTKKKIECKNYGRMYQNEPLKITKASVENYLSQEDKDFLESKPNYLKMVESMKICLDSINYLNKYKLDLIDYYKKSCNEQEYTRKMLADEMCASDLCDICNMKNCKWQDHKFDMEL